MIDTSMLNGIYQLIFNIDQFLFSFNNLYLALAVVCIIVFCETGLVVTPFLPGDSLLFVCGTLVAVRMPDALAPVCICIILAAILGNLVNYSIGSIAGRWILAHPIQLVRKEHMQKTEQFYARYGSKALVISRFVPLVRTIAPFAAGLASMPYAVFTLYNFVGAILWVVLFVLGGFFLGTVPIIRENISAVMVGIILISISPAVWGVVRSLVRRVEGYFRLKLHE